MTKVWIVCLVAIGTTFLVLSEIPFIKGYPFHVAIIFAHLGVAFIVAGLVTMALEMPHYKVYIEKALSGIVIKAEYLKTLSPAQLLNLRRDCDLAQLDFSKEETKEETKSNFSKEVESSFYRYVSEDAWTSLITSHYRTNYTQSAVYSDNNCPDGFWKKTLTLKYTLYQGIPSKGTPKQNLRIFMKDSFLIDHKLLQTQPHYHNSTKSCVFTKEKCCFTECNNECLFISTLQLTVDKIVYSLDLEKKMLMPNKVKDNMPQPIPITINPQLSKGRVIMEFNYELLDKEKADVEIVESKLVKKIDEITSIKMNLPTRDAVFIFNFPEGIITEAIYFGFREVNPFTNKGTNNVYARLPSWMFPGDGVAVAWWVSPPTQQGTPVVVRHN